MAVQRNPRHRAGNPSRAAITSLAPAAPTAARRRPRGPARHLRLAPGAAGATTAGIAAVLVLGPTVGLVTATATGEVLPEHAGRFGPVVAALTWQDGSQVGELVAQHAENQASGTPVTGTPDGVAGASERGAPDDEAAEDPAESDPSSPPGTDDATDPGADGTATDEAPGVAPDTEATPDGSPGASEDDTATGGTDGDDGAGGGEDATGPEPESGDVVVRPRAVTPTPEPGGPTAEATAVADLTNAERAEAGCDPLVVDERLTAAAQLHSEDMLAQDYFDHTSLDGRSPWDRAKAQGYANPSGENIAKGQATAADVVRAWMDSPGHRANILNCDFREIGVGYADRVWTQLFGWG